MKNCFSVSLILLVFAAPAFAANPGVNSPINGATVSSPFTLSASSPSCSSEPVTSMAYSINSGADAATVKGDSIDVQVTAATGTQTLHVKAWGDKGAGCDTDIKVNVKASSGSVSNGATSAGPDIPSSAIRVSSIQTMKNWILGNDPKNGGSSSGKMSIVGSPSHGGSARETVTSYKNAGGERYWDSFGDDTSATNFVYDGWVYLPSSATNLANLEMDMNQVMSDGRTVIFGFECDGYNNTWDYTANKGTPTKPKDTWIKSKAACKMSSWSRNTWHHVQVEYSRNDSGDVTYQAVWLDGTKQTIGATVPSVFALGWAPVLLTNLQVDGKGSKGTITVYLDDLTISRW